MEPSPNQLFPANRPLLQAQQGPSFDLYLPIALRAAPPNWYPATVTVGGTSLDLDVDGVGQYAYLGNGHRVVSLFVGGPASLTLETLRGRARTGESQPHAVGWSPELPGIVERIRLRGSYLYVLAGGSLTSLDVSDPARIIRRGAVRGFAAPPVSDLYRLEGAPVLVLATKLGVHLIDVSNPPWPKPMITIAAQSGYREDFLDGAALGGHYLFVGEAYHSGVRVFDLAQPNAPRELGTVLDGEHVPLSVHGDLLFTVIRRPRSGLEIYDVRAPLQPKLVGRHEGSVPDRLTVADGIAYGMWQPGGWSSHYGASRTDVSAPGQPVSMTPLETQGHAFAVEVRHGRAYVAVDSARIHGGSGLRVFGVEEKNDPRLLGRWESIGSVQGIALAGDLAYLKSGDFGLRVVDVSDPSSPRHLGSWSEGGAEEWRGGYPMWPTIAVDGHTALIAGQYKGLVTLDVSDPTSPRLASILSVAGPEETGPDSHLPGPADSIVVADGRALVTFAESFLESGALSRPGGLAVVDVSDPEQPRVRSTLAATGFPLAVATDGEIAVLTGSVRDGGVELTSVDISDPTALRVLGRLRLTGDSHDHIPGTAIVGNLAVLCSWRRYVLLVDLSDTAHMSEVGRVAARGSCNALAFHGGRLHVTGRADIRAFQVSPDGTTELDWAETIPVDSFQAASLAVNDNYAFVAGRAHGLVIVRLPSVDEAR